MDLPTTCKGITEIYEAKFYGEGTFGNIFVPKNPGLFLLNSYILVKPVMLDPVEKACEITPTTKAKFSVNEVI